MKTSRNGWVAVAVAAVLAWGGADSLHAAVISWDGNGDANNDGNWSTALNWSDNLDPANDSITLPDVTGNGNSGNPTRTITVNSAYAANALTLSQTTTGFTNKLVLAANLTLPNGVNVAFSGNGPIVVDIGNKQLKAFGGGTTRNYGQNITWYSSAGTFLDASSSSTTLFNLQGTMNLTAGATTMTFYRGFQVDTTGVLNLTSGGGADVGILTNMTIKGTVNGNSTGSLKARTLILDTGSAVPTSVANIRANNLSIRSATPGNFDLTGTTLTRVSSATRADYEAAASGTGTDFKIGTLSFGNVGQYIHDGIRNRLVNTYANSGNQASEYFLVGTFDGSNTYSQEFDFNGQKLVIDGGVANYSGYNAGNLRLSNRSAGNGVMEFRTAGGALSLNASIGVSGGGTLQIVGPASIINARLYSPGTALGSAGGTIAFNGNFRTDDASITDFNNANSTTTLDLSGNTFTFFKNTTQGSITVSSNATFIVKGNVTGEGAGSGKGLRALGTTKSGTGTPPAIMPSGTVIVSGDVSSTGYGLTLHIGRDASFKVGGNFAAGNWNSSLSGSAAVSFFADTSPNAGSFIFNGGGASVQTMEVLSRGYTAITGLRVFQTSGTAAAAGQTVTGATSGATATIDFINGNILQLTSVTGTFQADETLAFSGGGAARASYAQFAGLDGRTSSSIKHLPIGTLSIGDPAGTNASVKLVNNFNPWGGSAENTQAARSLTVTTNSTFDLASFEMVVAAGTNSTVAGLVTNSVAGGTLTLANGATLKFETGGVIDVDTLTINTGCTVDFNAAVGSYFRVNGDQKAAFDAMIGGQIIDNGGDLVKTDYSAGDDHTTVYLAARPPSGTVILVR